MLPIHPTIEPFIMLLGTDGMIVLNCCSTPEQLLTFIMIERLVSYSILHLQHNVLRLGEGRPAYTSCVLTSWGLDDVIGHNFTFRRCLLSELHCWKITKMLPIYCTLTMLTSVSATIMEEQYFLDCWLKRSCHGDWWILCNIWLRIKPTSILKMCKAWHQ